MHSPRNPGHLVRIKVPVAFNDYREVDDVAQLAVEIMNRRASFVTYPLDSIGFIAVKLALVEAESDQEIAWGKSIMQAILAAKVPARQTAITYEALSLMREKDPSFDYPTWTRQA